MVRIEVTSIIQKVQPSIQWIGQPEVKHLLGEDLSSRIPHAEAPG
jgi:hypothetical protein